MKIKSILLTLAFLPALAFGQMFQLSQTTTSSPVLLNDTFINVTSATGINAKSIAGNQPGSQLYVQDPGSAGELMKVLSIVNTTQIYVQRGLGGTQATAHIAGATVLAGNGNWMFAYNPQGACTPSLTYVTPWLNTNSGALWQCSSYTGTWIPSYQNDLWPKAPSASVIGTAGALLPSGTLFHVITTAGAITSITIPAGFVYGSITLIPDVAFTLVQGNNISASSTAIVGKPLTLTYDPVTKLFSPSY